MIGLVALPRISPPSGAAVLLSRPAPASARLTVAPGLGFVMSQHFYLPGRTDVEQFLFADAGKDGLARRLLWIQFEHKMPENNGTYNYPPSPAAAVSGLSVLYDTKVYTDY